MFWKKCDISFRNIKKWKWEEGGENRWDTMMSTSNLKNNTIVNGRIETNFIFIASHLELY